MLERARGRTIAEAIRSRLIEPERKETDVSSDSEEITGLNSALLAAKSVVERKELLDRLFIAEQRMAPSIAGQNAYFRKVVPRPVSIEELHSVLRSDEIVLQFVLSEPSSYCLAITRNGLTAQELMGQSKLDTLIDEYLHEVRQKGKAFRPSKGLYSALLGGVENLTGLQAAHYRSRSKPVSRLLRIAQKWSGQAAYRVACCKLCSVNYCPSFVADSASEERSGLDAVSPGRCPLSGSIGRHDPARAAVFGRSEVGAAASHSDRGSFHRAVILWGRVWC